MKGLAERFAEKTAAGPNGCVNWVGAIKWSGYGQMVIDGRRRTAPQVAWILSHGDWPDGYVLHSCDNRLCVNLEHLRVGTHQENIADATRRGRWAKGESHGMSRLNTRAVQRIIGLSRGGLSGASIARRFGVSQQVVCDIKKGRRWSHVTGIARAA